jgi:hypothetical protein
LGFVALGLSTNKTAAEIQSLPYLLNQYILGLQGFVSPRLVFLALGNLWVTSHQGFEKSGGETTSHHDACQTENTFEGVDHGENDQN